MIRLLLALLLLVCMQPVLAQETSLASLFAALAAHNSKQADFTEVRTAFYLDEPLVSKGTMSFFPPATLEKHYTTPEPLSQLIEGDNLHIRQPGKAETSISLASQPALALGINAIRWLLSGDKASLDGHFSIEYQALNPASEWQLILIPLEKQMLDYIGSITIKGKDGVVNYIQLVSANGDSITTELYAQQ